MIKAFLFAACEKVIISDKNNTSLISVLERVTVNRRSDIEIPLDAALPFNWGIVTLWHRLGELEEPKTYQARIELKLPNGESGMGIELEFEVTNQHINYRNEVSFPFFPIGMSGTCLLTLDYKQKDSEEDWQTVGAYPIIVIHSVEEISNAEETSQIKDESTTESQV
jgi:hypothetical protein